MARWWRSGRSTGTGLRPVLLSGAILLAGPLSAQAPGPELDEAIRSRIEDGDGGAGPVIVVGGETLYGMEALPRFYERRGFQPAWVDETGPRPAADSLIAAVERADREGLNPRDYHLDRLRALRADASAGAAAAGGPATGAGSATGPGRSSVGRATLADLDLLLTDAFLLYGTHLVSGRVNPVEIHPEWNAGSREADLVPVLESALGTGRIGGALDSLLPAHPGYARLTDALALYRGVAAEGGWPALPGRTIRPGDRGGDVTLLRRRLAASGDLPADRADGDTYDGAVEEAVRRFQRRHALEADGVAGLSTTTLMNVPVEERIRRIELNLERWRWLPRDLGARHIIVNIAGYQAQLVEGDSTTFRTRVLVGQPYRRTPVFSDRMTYLVLNPTWTIPPNILEVDKLPLIRRDPNYLAQQHIRVLDRNGRTVDPSTIDWAAVTGATSYRLRMDPGPENPLGRIKFMFPNPYHIYLHDTPERDLFDRTNRAFSSGCIRVENPMELARLLLRDEGWTADRLRVALEDPGEQTIPLKRPVSVHLLYWTAWVDDDGLLQLRPDIYDRDAALDAALRQPPPTASAARAAPGQGA